MAYSKTLYIRPTTLTDLTVTLTRKNEVVNTWTLSDFVLGSQDGINYYLQGTIKGYIRNDVLTISSTGYQTQTIDIWRMTTDNITLTPLEFSNIETNSIKYYCKDEVARNSITSIATDLNNKAGTDLANVTDSAKVMMAGMGMPSNRYIDLTLGASGSTYTAPANGWFCLKNNAGADNPLLLDNQTNGMSIMQSGGIGGFSGNTIYLPCSKGDIVRANYTGPSGSTTNIYFIYAQGSESEAS